MISFESRYAAMLHWFCSRGMGKDKIVGEEAEPAYTLKLMTDHRCWAVITTKI